MAKKRANGEGSIYQRTDGKWCSTITVGINPLTGKPKRKSFYGKTRKEVSEKLIEAQSKAQNGIIIESIDLKVNAWLDIWLSEYKKTSVRAKTYENYEYLIRVHINPHIGNEQLKKLSPETVQRFYNMLSKTGRSDGKGGLSSKTVRNIHNLLHEALQQAVKNDKIFRNVTEATTLPRKQQKEIKILTRQDEFKFLETASQDRLGIAFIVCLATGVRLGELLGLHWSDVNMTDGIINIKQSLVRVRTFDDNSKNSTKLVFQEPKTKAGRRTIPLPPSVLLLLKSHRTYQIKEKLLSGELYKDTDLVFCTESGAPIDPRNLIRKFQQILKKAGLQKINFHALRHTYATRLLELNEHPKVVQVILGHTNISVTLDIYSHVLPEVKKSAATKIDHLFQFDSSLIKESLACYAI